MQWLGKIKGSSLIEVLIASSIFSVLVLQAIAQELRLYCTVRECLETTQRVITEESHYRVEKKNHTRSSFILGKVAGERSPRNAYVVHDGGERAQPAQHKIKVERVSGSSLIEVMLSLTLALILALSFIQVIVIANNLYVKHESLTKIQENARSIHAILREYYTRKDAMGCNRWGNDLNVFIQPGVNLNVDKSKLRHLPILDSDIISIDYVSEKITQKFGTIVVLSSCRQAKIFVLQEKDLLLANDETLGLGQYHSVILYVAKTDRTNEKGEPVYALYSTDLNGQTQERVEGVEKIKLEQGLESMKLQFLLTASSLKKWWTWEF